MSIHDETEIISEILDLVGILGAGKKKSLGKYNLTYNEIGKRLNEMIRSGQTKFWRREFKTRTDTRRYLLGEVGSTFPAEKWRELRDMLKQIVEEIDGVPGGVFVYSSLGNLIQKKASHTKKKVVLGLFPCQDTILPLFFRQSFNRNLTVEFKEYRNWGDALSAFTNEEVDVCLHNFPTAVAYNAVFGKDTPLFFYPLFTFQGYGVLLRKTFLSNEVASFLELPKDQKRKIIQSGKILVERYTDFEWILTNYAESLGIDDVQAIQENFIDMDTNTAGGFFKDNPEIVLHCTNPIHIRNILSDKNHSGEFELIAYSNMKGNLTYKNINGFICSKLWVDQNPDIFSELVATWFNDIGLLKAEIERYHSSTAVGSPFGDSELTYLRSLVDFLHALTGAAIELKDLLQIYDNSNTFFTNPHEVSNLLQEIDIHSTIMLNPITEIATLQLKNESANKADILQALNSLIREMKVL